MLIWWEKRTVKFVLYMILFKCKIPKPSRKFVAVLKRAVPRKKKGGTALHFGIAGLKKKESHNSVIERQLRVDMQLRLRRSS